jgi:predicted enzyme related to lactoylglutathione lyase
MRKYLIMFALVIGTNVYSADMMPKSGEFVWNELATPDLKATKDFYGKVFGWEFVDKKMDTMTYTIVKKENKEFGGIWAIPKEQQSQIPAHWVPYILVDNIEQTLEKARQNGATVLKPAQKAGDMGMFAIIKDPTGASVALWQNLKK